jgi:hypothetical protein
MPTVDANNRIAGIQGAKNTLDSLNDLSSAEVTALGLDAPVSSRLAASSYVAPDNAGIADTGAGVADLLARLTSTRAALLDALAHLDADVSSRLSTAGYMAPDNAGIAAVQAKTDNLPANPAATGDAMTLDLAQPVPLTNTAQTVGDALNAARAEGFGNWSFDVPTKTMTLFAPDGSTPVHSFIWNDANDPTSRN